MMRNIKMGGKMGGEVLCWSRRGPARWSIQHRAQPFRFDLDADDLGETHDVQDTITILHPAPELISGVGCFGAHHKNC